MKLRSLLFVPGDRPDLMEKAAGCGADALILDLEDSVALSGKVAARKAVHEFLTRSRGEMIRFVRINPLAGGLADADLGAVMSAGPDGLVLPKSESVDSIRDLDKRLSAIGEGFPVVLPIATETPNSLFGLAGYGQVRERLAGLTWGAEDLSSAVGASTAREPDGSFTEPYRIARSMALFAAAAANVAPIETVYPAFKDLGGLAQYARCAMRDGFTGMMAIHPAQVAVINEAFTPSSEALERARAIIAAFEANPGVGVLSLNGAMIDAPHLEQAKRLLNRQRS